MMHLKTQLTLLIACAFSIGSMPHMRAADQEKTFPALSRGLAYLASRQKEDGSVSGDNERNSVGITGLAALAMMMDKAHEERVKKAAIFILSRQNDEGYFQGGSMYDHAYATLFLAEYWRASAQPDVKEKLVKAVELIVKSQGNEGGWRYQPKPLDGDTSVTSCQLLALAAVRRAGLDVPAATFSAGVEFLKRCQNFDGGFGYTKGGQGTSGFARSAASLAASLATQKWTKPDSRPDSVSATEYLLRFLPQEGTAFKSEAPWFIHGHYNAGQALRAAGGDEWKRWHDFISHNLVASQQSDGSWNDQMIELATSEACLILQSGNAVPAR